MPAKQQVQVKVKVKGKGQHQRIDAVDAASSRVGLYRQHRHPAEALVADKAAGLPQRTQHTKPAPMQFRTSPGLSANTAGFFARLPLPPAGRRAAWRCWFRLHESAVVPGWFRARTTALVLALLLSSLTTCACAATLSFSPNGEATAGSVACDVPVSGIGALTLQDGRSVIRGSVIEVQSATNPNLPPQVVLSGTVIHLEVVPSSANTQITGLALFAGGTLLPQLDDPSATELIFRPTGALRGRVGSVQGTVLQMNASNGIRQNIDIDSVLFIRSPRAFTFTLSTRRPSSSSVGDPFTADVIMASFKPTATRREVSASSVVPDHPRAGVNWERYGLRPTIPLSDDDDDVGNINSPSWGNMYDGK
jgi:hypothetical protein